MDGSVQCSVTPTGVPSYVRKLLRNAWGYMNAFEEDGFGHGRDAGTDCTGRRRHVDAIAAAGHRRTAARGGLPGQSRRPRRSHQGAAQCGGQGRWRDWCLRQRRGPGADQSPRRVRGDPVQQQRAAQPDRAGLRGGQSRRGAAGQPGFPPARHGRLRPGHRAGAGQRPRQDWPRLLRRGGRGEQGAGRRVRARGRHALQRGEHVLRPRLLPGEATGAARRAAGLRAAARDRQLRRRGGQLHVAAPQRRLHRAACLRRSRRQAGGLFERQPAVHTAGAPADRS